MRGIKAFLQDYAVPVVCGILGSFVGMGLAHWLGLMLLKL